jgi:hypothetical protein
MLLGLLVLLTALTISAVAIYYSVVGLVAIFAAAALPIMIMGGVLEVGKLVTAVWLHRYWKDTVWWLKTYLSFAVVLLMFITSMGIFGFLSKAHIEQTSAGEESVAQVERIVTEIARQESIIVRAEAQIEKAESSINTQDNTVQEQIDREQKRIDGAYTRIQPAIAEQLEVIQIEEDKIQKRLEPYQNQVDAIAASLAQLEAYVNAGDRDSIKKAQGLIGASADGSYGRRTAAKVQEFRDNKNQERIDLLNKMDELQSLESPIVAAARAEIVRQRGLAETEIANSNALISRLREQIGRVEDNSEDIDAIVDEQTARIRTANTELDKLTEEKYTLEAEYRKLEAEVGPIKYIAEFVYGEQADQNLLEEAVRWVILLIIFVFDPLAVLLLIASQYTFEALRNKKKDEKEFDWDDYERKRAQAIVNNPGPDDSPEEDNNDRQDELRTPDAEPSEETRREEATDFAESIVKQYTSDDSGTTERDDRGQPGTTPLANDVVYEIAKTTDEIVKEQMEAEELVPPKFDLTEELKAEELVPKEIQPAINMQIDEEWQEREKPETKKKVESSERLKDLEAKEQDEAHVAARTQWKSENPDQTLKHYKNLYTKGVIDSLPWEEKEDPDKYKREPLTEVIEPEGYQQNGEQDDSTLFNKFKK